VLTVHDGKQLLQLVEQNKGDVVVTDVMMPGESGLDILPRIKQYRPSLPVIVISAQNTLITAVKASQLGAYDYLPKPFDLDALTECVANSVKTINTHTLAYAEDFEAGSTPIIGRSAAMQEIYRTLARVIGVDLSILITGESGTGKELVARALHALGNRKHKPFLALNMAAIPRDLVESELFGHEKGAFTGAVARKTGAFEQAEGGMLFLDEIGDMPLEAQTRLLRVLQQGEYTPVGSTSTIKTNVRIISATHADLTRMVYSGMFRTDLYYRLNVVQVRMPPLRERKDDIAALITHFLAKAESKGLPRKEITQNALPSLEAHLWPGNVRELENFIYRLITLYAEPVISAETVQKELAAATLTSYAKEDSLPLCDIVHQHVSAYFKNHGHSLPSSGLYDRLMPLFEKPLIEVTLEATGGNQFKAAAVLGINRNTLRKKINALGIETSRK
jgi:two-component system, NtrC family, nitrogen regulation response regulator GlnG